MSSRVEDWVILNPFYFSSEIKYSSRGYRATDQGLLGFTIELLGAQLVLNVARSTHYGFVELFWLIDTQKRSNLAFKAQK